MLSCLTWIFTPLPVQTESYAREIKSSPVDYNDNKEIGPEALVPPNDCSFEVLYWQSSLFPHLETSGQTLF